MAFIIALVLILLVLYLILKGTGLLDELINVQRNPDDNLFTRIGSQIARLDQEEQGRLDVYREYFEEEPDPDEE